MGPLPEAQVSRDEAVIKGWSADALAHGLFLPKGWAQFVFRGEAKIRRMAYIPGIAWVMVHDIPGHKKPWTSGFTHPDYRRRGICRQLFEMVMREVPPAPLLSTVTPGDWTRPTTPSLPLEAASHAVRDRAR